MWMEMEILTALEMMEERMLVKQFNIKKKLECLTPPEFPSAWFTRRKQIFSIDIWGTDILHNQLIIGFDRNELND